MGFTVKMDALSVVWEGKTPVEVFVRFDCASRLSVVLSVISRLYC